MSEVREIIRRVDVESLRQEFGSQYIIEELLWYLVIEITAYAQVKPGCEKRDDDRGLHALKWDLQVQSRLMECLRTMHNHRAEKQTNLLVRIF